MVNPWSLCRPANEREMPSGRELPSASIQPVSTSTFAVREEAERIRRCECSSGRMSHRRPSSTGPRGLRIVRALVLVTMIPAVLPGPYSSALAIDCPGSERIDEFVTGTVRFTVLHESDGVVTRSRVKKKGSTLTVPMCILEIDYEKRAYKVRFDDGTIALVNRRFVLKSTDKPPITVNCDEDELVAGIETAIVREIGEDPCR